MLDFSTGAQMAADAADSSREALTTWVESSLREEDRT